MSTYTAVVCDARTIGGAAQSSVFPMKTGTIGPLAGGYFPRLNPQFASARIRTVVAPHIVQDAIGGFISADFTIPAEEAQRWRPVLRYGAVVWLFDGQTPIFYGYAEQPVWTTTGDCQMTLSGPWAMLGKTRMREAWEQWDMSLLTRSIGAAENKAGQVNLNSDGSLTLSFPNGTVLAAGDHVGVDILLFGEVAGGADGKLITAFELDMTTSNNLTANNRVRVIGGTSPSSVTDQLYDTGTAGTSTGIQDSLNLHGANQGAASWPSITGYRCLRIMLTRITTGITLANDTYVTFDRIRVSTRAGLFPQAGVGGIDTAAIVRDIVTPNEHSTGGGSQIATTAGSAGLNGHDQVHEYWRSEVGGASPDTNSSAYQWGRDPVTGTGTAPNSGIVTTGFTALEWQSPADIIQRLAAIDGSHVGFYFPYNNRGGYDPAGAPLGGDAGSWWVTAPPQLYYQPFPDPNYSPDYTIQTKQGAVVAPSPDAQPLINALYVNYQTNRGRQQSVVTGDTNQQNYVWDQGLFRADDYTLQTAGDATQGASLGGQQLALRRQPYASATITITNTGTLRNAILKNGASVPKLATIRPSSMRIVDIPATANIRAGYATHIEWWGQTLTSDEHCDITLAQPGIYNRQRAHGVIVNRYRNGTLLGRKLL